MRAPPSFTQILCGILLMLAMSARAQLPILVEKVGLAGGVDPYGGELSGKPTLFQREGDGWILFQPADSTTRLFSGTLGGIAKRLGAGAKATDHTIVSNFIVSSLNAGRQIALLGF